MFKRLLPVAPGSLYGCSILPSFQTNKMGVGSRPSSSTIDHPSSESVVQVLNLNSDGGHVYL